MNPDEIYAKTEEGVRELKERTHNLPIALRSLLIMIDGNRTVVMDVRRQSGQNTVQVVDAVKAKLASMRRTLPPEVQITMTRDDSQFIHASIAALEEHLILGSLLASVVIMIFIRNLRVVLVSSLAIPASSHTVREAASLPTIRWCGALPSIASRSATYTWSRSFFLRSLR